MVIITGKNVYEKEFVNWVRVLLLLANFYKMIV